MKKGKLQNLIEKYLSGKITEEEKQYLNKWYAFYEGVKEYTSVLEHDEKQILKQEMLHFIKTKTNSGHNQSDSHFYKWRKIAATTIGILLLTFCYSKWFYAPRIVHSTDYGQQKTLVLPDNSVVTLNANSTLSYEDDWDNESDREVWLEGEGFFSVSHQDNLQKFLVYTADDLYVEVLGTEFSVAQRKSGTSIALKSGSIKLHIPTPLDQENSYEEVMMEPGEIVKLDPEIRKYVIDKERDLEKYYAWTNRKLVLDNSSLREVLSKLKDTYGIEFKTTSDALYLRSASGSMPLPQDLEQLLTNIALLYDLTYEKQSEYILLKE